MESALKEKDSKLIISDENDNPGKGANCVISMLHDYLERYTTANQEILLHANNAVGRNKNNAMIHYCAWRILTGRSLNIKLSFMIAGHTKFSPDRFFGLIKKTYCNTSVYTMYDMERIVINSTTGGQNIALPTVDVRSGERNVNWYNWSDYLNNIFHAIPSILNYHHFTLDKSTPGIVSLQEYIKTDKISFSMLKNEPQQGATGFPSVVTPTGLSVERQLYLYQKIRPYCASEADLTCPIPAIALVSSKPCSGTASGGSKRSTTLCSHCRKPGHTKTVRGVTTCPELTNKQ